MRPEFSSLVHVCALVAKSKKIVLIALQFDLTISTDFLVSYASNGSSSQQIDYSEKIDPEPVSVY